MGELAIAENVKYVTYRDMLPEVMRDPFFPSPLTVTIVMIITKIMLRTLKVLLVLHFSSPVNYLKL